MDNLTRVREIMQWVRVCRQKEKKVTKAQIAADLDLPPSSVTRIVDTYYEECFNVEPHHGVTLTGNWPEDIAFDWETLKPLETPNDDAKFRPPKTDQLTATPVKKKEIVWDSIEMQDNWEIVNDLLLPPYTVTDVVDTATEEIYNAFNALSDLLKLRGPNPKKKFFRETTGLFYSKDA